MRLVENQGERILTAGDDPADRNGAPSLTDHTHKILKKGPPFVSGGLLFQNYLFQGASAGCESSCGKRRFSRFVGFVITTTYPQAINQLDHWDSLLSFFFPCLGYACG